MTRHRPVCPKDPNHLVRRNKTHDAYVCFVCRTWIEDKCCDGENSECPFCSTRPDVPPFMEDDLEYSGEEE